MIEYKFWQYPRGANKGGVLNTDICPTISCSSWESNCLLIEITDTCMLDTYNQQVQDNVSCTIRTNINTANHHFIMEKKTNENTAKTLCLNSKVDGKQPSLEDRIYDVNGIETAITCGFHVNIMEKESIVFDDYNQRIPQDQDCIGTITTNIGNSAQRNGYKIIEPQIQSCEKNQSAPKVINPLKGESQYGWHFEQEVYDKEGITRAVKSAEGSGNIPKVLVPSYRIRKLTERECFRLMGLADTDITKIQESGVSRSQQYKMAGNSIVVDVLFHIFRKLYIEPQCEHQQLTLF